MQLIRRSILWLARPDNLIWEMVLVGLIFLLAGRQSGNEALLFVGALFFLPVALLVGYAAIGRTIAWWRGEPW